MAQMAQIERDDELWSDRTSGTGFVFIGLGVLMVVAGWILMMFGALAAVSLVILGVPVIMYGVRLVRRDRTSNA